MEEFHTDGPWHLILNILSALSTQGCHRSENGQEKVLQGQGKSENYLGLAKIDISKKS